MVRVCKHRLIIGRRERGREPSSKCLSELACVLIDVIVPMIDIAHIHMTVIRFLQQSAPAVSFAIHTDAIADTR